ncbi:hypothetical protein RJ639_008597 [Escallonia herrerae]|uniref:Uncharacterized protein n=1 Tax=Escallonia herrerae TaxID=1293975 RepID=A0AA88VNW2_9ASTE|nr:hypothetical protein RJ639_008597 [Escallonia herrerae]
MKTILMNNKTALFLAMALADWHDIVPSATNGPQFSACDCFSYRNPLDIESSADQMKIPESSCRLLSLLQALKKPSSGDNPPLPSVAKLAKILPPLYSSLIISIKLEVHIVYEMTVTPPKGHVMALNLIIGCYKLSNALCKGIRICVEVLIIDVNSIQVILLNDICE